MDESTVVSPDVTSAVAAATAAANAAVAVAADADAGTRMVPQQQEQITKN